MGKIVIGFSIALALGLVTFGLIGAALRPRPQPPQLVSMADSGQAMIRAGTSMLTHAQSMQAQAQATGDVELQALADRWQLDGQDLVRRGQWMAADPIAPNNLLTPPGELSRQGAWGDLLPNAQAMAHDPTQAKSATDVQALRWDGLAMQAEGRNMADHARVMNAEVDAMTGSHGLQPADVAALHDAAQTLRSVGGNLQQNGQTMLDYADRLNRSLGVYP